MAQKAMLKRLGDVDVRLIRVFVVVAECGGFAASEFELNIGRSTISKHISDLELRLGITLCRRGPAGFALTAEGTQVLEAAMTMLRALDRFQADVDDIHLNLTGTFRFAISDQSSTNPAARLHEAIRLFDETAPKVALDIAILSPNVIEAQVIDGTLDVGIVPLHRRSASLNYLKLYDERMTLYCGETHALFGLQGDSDGHSTSPEIDLDAHKYAGFGFNSPNLAAGRRLGLRRAAQVQEEEALSLLVQSGRYLGFIADHVAETMLLTGKVRAVMPDRTAYVSTFAAISRRRRDPDRKTQAFLACLARAHGQSTVSGAG